MATPRLRHRPQTEDEDAAALKLGAGEHTPSTYHYTTHTVLPEFNNAGCLLISEVKYLLENREKEAPDTACVITTSNYDSTDSGDSVYNKTLEYVKTFAKFHTTDSASAVREWVPHVRHLCVHTRTHYEI